MARGCLSICTGPESAANGLGLWVGKARLMGRARYRRKSARPHYQVQTIRVDSKPWTSDVVSRYEIRGATLTYHQNTGAPLLGSVRGSMF